MSTNNPDVAVALYDEHTQAENGVKALQRAGFDMKKISISARITRPRNMSLAFSTPATEPRFSVNTARIGAV
jgi:hypothetical protein